jgi:hypothetical protein
MADTDGGRKRTAEHRTNDRTVAVGQQAMPQIKFVTGG